MFCNVMWCPGGRARYCHDREMKINYHWRCFDVKSYRREGQRLFSLFKECSDFYHEIVSV